MITVRDLLDDPTLRLRLLVDGDLDRPVRWVHVTELADASPYLVGDELILTAGVWRRAGASAAGFVAALQSRAVAGIAYGLLEGDLEVPTEVVRACAAAGIPLVEVPVATPFVAISQAFVDRWSSERERLMREALQLTDDLLRAANDPDDAGALHAVAGLLRAAVGAPVWISDAEGRVLARAGALPEVAAVRALATGVGEAPMTVDEWYLAPVDLAGVRAAIVGVAVGEPGLELRSRIDAARPVIGVVRARHRAVRETERRLAGEVVSLVLGRQLDAAAARMESYGVDPAGRLVTIVAAVSDRERALPAAEQWLERRHIPGVIALRGHELMVVLGDAEDGTPIDGHDAASSLATAVRALGVGLGAVSEGIEGLRRGLVQARHTCELARRRGDGTVVAHEMTGSHGLLLALQDQDVLDAFRDSLLAPLERYDATQGGDLVGTLRAFLASGGRWQETATLLHIHVNTLRHRIERIEGLTGRSLDETPDRVDLWLALQAVTAGAPEAL